MQKENYNNCHWNVDTIHFSPVLNTNINITFFGGLL